MTGERIVAVVADVERPRARELLGKDVLVVSSSYGQVQLLGYRFALVLRTYPNRNPKDAWENNLLMRLAPHARTVIGDLESLAAILGAIRQVTPWVIEGAAPRR